MSCDAYEQGRCLASCTGSVNLSWAKNVDAVTRTAVLVRLLGFMLGDVM